MENSQKQTGRTRRPITITDIAKMANVGIGTVSRVINNSGEVSAATAARVRKVLEKTRYRPAYAARTLARGKANCIELWYNTSAANLSEDQIFLRVLDRAKAELKNSPYRLLFSTIASDFQDFPRDLLHGLNFLVADAALLVSCQMSDEGLEVLRGRPLVLMDSPGKGMVTSVYNDHYNVVRQATGRLIENGHKRILFIHQADVAAGDRERLRGYKDEMADRGLRETNLIVPDTTVSPQTSMHVDLGDTFKRDDRPTAILVTMTHMLVDVMKQLAEAGLSVPEDVSICEVHSSTPDADPLLPELGRLFSGYYLSWQQYVHTAMREVMKVADGSYEIHDVIVPFSYHEHGTIVPPRNG